MLFQYKAVDNEGRSKEGEIDAGNRDMAISALQRRGLIIISIKDQSEKKSIFKLKLFEKVSQKDVVIFSRQIATLFEAQVSALKAFGMLASNTENKLLGKKLLMVSDDLQAGVSISDSLAKHPDVFSEFYINMIKAGEEIGKLDQTFLYLADYLDRQYALTSKTKTALIYPAFVICTFFIVMSLMFVIVIQKLSEIILDSGQTVPFYTNLLINISNIFIIYVFLIVIFIILLGIYIWWLSISEKGKNYLDQIKLSVPILGNLYRKLYLSRIADNLDTMLTSGIPIIRAIDVTSKVVGNRIYKNILSEVSDGVKSGLALSVAFERHTEVPNIMVQMVKVGEETGALGSILKTLALFYKREVDDALDTMVSLIEPVMIVVLGVGVGILLVSILMPIYNIAGGIS